VDLEATEQQFQKKATLEKRSEFIPVDYMVFDPTEYSFCDKAISELFEPLLMMG